MMVYKSKYRCKSCGETHLGAPVEVTRKAKAEAIVRRGGGYPLVGDGPYVDTTVVHRCKNGLGVSEFVGLEDA